MDIPYFMDSATFWEIDNVLECLPYCDRNFMESQRLSTFIQAKAHFKGISKPQDIATFEWEKEHKEEKETNPDDIEISNEEIKRLKELSKKWER